MRRTLLVSLPAPRGKAAARLRPRAPAAMVRQALASLPPGTVAIVLNEPRDLPAALMRWRKAADEVRLLYPDPIGLGALTVDLAALRDRSRAPEVLNGRGRRFVLTPRLALRLWLRRALVHTWAPEILSLAVFALALPLLAAPALLAQLRRAR